MEEYLIHQRDSIRCKYIAKYFVGKIRNYYFVDYVMVRLVFPVFNNNKNSQQ